jgi:1,4-alpha-glucan branching enzyme
VDFPREGNQWSYKYARRQWSLAKVPELRYRFLLAWDRAMMALINEMHIFDCLPQKLLVHDGDKIISFERGGLFFFFNFHPSKSFSDYKIEVLPGEYELVLDSDAQEFGGHCRLEQGQHYFTQQEPFGKSSRNMVSLYLPSRSALVLKRVKD